MKRLFKVLLAATLFAAAVSTGWGAPVPQPSGVAGVLSSIAGAAQLGKSEQILSYDVTAEIQEDAGLLVREDLTIMVTNDRIKKGIVRAFPVEYRDPKGRPVFVGFDVQSTSVDGQKMSWTEAKEGRAVMVRIGDPKTTLAPGVHRFTLEYRATGELGFYEKHDELYWNVTGNEWKFPILKASFAAKLPGKARGEGFSAIQWYTGPSGSKSIKGARKNADGSVSTTAPLAVGEGLTVVYAWPKGVIAKPVPPEPSALDKATEALYDRAETIAQVILWGGAALSAVFVLLALKNALQSRRSAKTVIPLFRAPQGMTPALARYVRTTQPDNVCFSAELLNLAVAGKMKIQALSKKSYQLVLQKKDGALNLGPLDREISQALFYGSAHIGMVLPLDEEHGSYFRAAKDSMDVWLKDAGKKLFTLSRKMAFGVYGPLFLSGILVFLLREWLDGGINDNTVSLSGVTFAMSFFCFIWSSLRSQRRSRGGLVRSVVFWIIMSLFVVAMLSLITEFEHPAFGCVLTALFASGILLAPFSVHFTEAGLEAQAAVDGLRMYINAAEKDRLEMFNPPDDTPEVFEKLLPYAVALDCVKTWAARFDSVLKAAQYSPDWYDGDLWRDREFAALSAAQMASSLNNFASNFSSSLNTTTTPPGSSSGLSDSWGSDGGGGGSSGGGGGGGGGDGW